MISESGSCRRRTRVKANDRETLNRAAGILEGLSASGDLSQAVTDVILNVCEMIDAVMREDDKK